MLGDADGNGPGGFACSTKKFEVTGRWENGGDTPPLNYDFWYQPRHNVMVSSELGAPNTTGASSWTTSRPASTASRIHFWDSSKRTLDQTIDLGAKGLIPLEVRFHHNPAPARLRRRRPLQRHVPLPPRERRLGSRQGHRGRGVELKGWPFPVPGLITDLVLSLDDRYLYFSNWLHGDVRQYDVSDPRTRS